LNYSHSTFNINSQGPRDFASYSCSKMQLLTLLSALAFVPSVLSASIPGPSGGLNLVARDGDRGHYTVSGLGARKQAILNAGGNTQDLAIAMLET
jgi:hypothetical protein